MGPDAVTAVATTLIAIFTITLWWSTRRLWEAGEKQFAATHRPRLKVRYIKLAIHSSGTFIQYMVVNTGVSAAIIKRHTLVVLHKKSARRPCQLECFRLTGGEDRVIEFDLANTFDDTFEVLTLKVRGTIEYEDGIGTKRRTGFAGTYDSNLDWFRRSTDPEEEYDD